MIIANYIAFVLLCIGGLVWGIIGFSGFNLVAAIFGATIWASIIYVLVFLSMIWLILALIIGGGTLNFRK